MRLWYSEASPYARKVRVALIHHQLDKTVELLSTTPFDAKSKHNEANPLGKVPALEISTGQWLYDSRVIVEYLDSIGEGQALFAIGDKRWVALKLQAIADGMIDNAVPIIYEKYFREDKQFWLARHQQLKERNTKTLTLLNAQADTLGDTLTIGTVALVCAIDWMVFRQEALEVDVQDVAPQLLDWAESMNTTHTALAITYPK